MDMSMVRKHCTRCNRGIYTSWRTLDEKKYYHPHCFTCVKCGEILNSDQVATTTLEELHCERCHIQQSGVNLHNTDERTSTLSTTTNASSDSSVYCYTKLNGDNNNVNVLYSTPSPFLLIQDKEQSLQLGTDGATRNLKKKVKARNVQVSGSKNTDLRKNKSTLSTPPSLTWESSRTIGTANGQPEHKNSRIPRPTSAQSKKSLPASPLPAKSKSKVSRSQLEKLIKNPVPRPPPPSSRKNPMVAPKMQRSISLVQARKIEVSSLGIGDLRNSPSPHNCSNRSSSQGRPRSAVTSIKDEKFFVISPSHQQNMEYRSPAKRQCAATFSTKRKKGSKNVVQENALDKNNIEGPSPFLTEVYSQSLKGGIPSTQAILTAIQREGSDIYKLKSSSGIQLSNNESYVIPSDENSTVICQSYTPALPKRSFNMTFECPICISSLVPGNSNYEKGCSDEGSQCRNVVTPCGHLFHGKCMDNWLKIKGNKRCPICSALCLPETLQPVYLECNLCADFNPKTVCMPVDSNSSNRLFGIGNGMNEITNASFRTLRSEYELLKAKYNAVLAENHNYSLNVTLANSLQSAYEMECRNRLQLQWENRKLLMKIEELKNSKQCTFN